MPKVHPNAAAAVVQGKKVASSEVERPICVDKQPGNPQVLTVWKKSLLFNCNGFTVFDAKGNLFFRVDNYASGNKAEIFLMDAAGKPLLTIRRKQRLGLVDNWMVYQGETDVNPILMAKKAKQVKFFSSKSSLAQIIGCNKNIMYEIEGSYAQRCCSVYDNQKRVVAEIKRKEALAGGAASFGNDVFRLIVQPDFDPPVAMALVILLEQMFGSRRSISF